MPATAAVSLMAIGTPAKGRGSPALIASAAASAPSGSRCTKALKLGLKHVDALQRLLDELARAELTAPDEGRELTGGLEHQLRHSDRPYGILTGAVHFAVERFTP